MRGADVLGQDRSLALQGRELFGWILRLNSEVEYLEIEMGPMVTRGITLGPTSPPSPFC